MLHFGNHPFGRNLLTCIYCICDVPFLKFHSAKCGICEATKEVYTRDLKTDVKSCMSAIAGLL